MIAWTIFLNPIELSSWMPLPLILPLCAAVALCYKTLRVGHISELPKQAVWVLAYTLAGLTLLGSALWLMLEFMS